MKLETNIYDYTLAKSSKLSTKRGGIDYARSDKNTPFDNAATRFVGVVTPRGVIEDVAPLESDDFFENLDLVSVGGELKPVELIVYDGTRSVRVPYRELYPLNFSNRMHVDFLTLETAKSALHNIALKFGNSMSANELFFAITEAPKTSVMRRIFRAFERNGLDLSAIDEVYTTYCRVIYPNGNK